MFNLKKYFTDELLQVALILSLLRIDRRSLEYNVPAIGVGTANLTSGWDQSNILVRREAGIHPKSIDSILVHYERQLFDELNSLGRYGRLFESALGRRNLTAFLLNVDEPGAVGGAEEDEEEASVSTDCSGANSRASARRAEQRRKDVASDQLSPEDLDIIEALWKYDIYVENGDSADDPSERRSSSSSSSSSLVAPPDEPFAPDGSPSLTPEHTNPFEDAVPRNSTTILSQEEFLAEEIVRTENDDEDAAKQIFNDELLSSDPWLGASSSYSWRSDRERSISERTDEDDVLLNGIEDNVASPAIFDPESSLEETLQLIDLNEVDQFPIDFWQLLSVKTEADGDNIKKEEETEEETKEDPGIEADFLDDELDLLTNMIHAPAPQYHHHSRPFQSRTIGPYVRTMGMDHRWPDFASMMNFPDAAATAAANHAGYHHHYHHHAPPPPPVPTSNYPPSAAAAVAVTSYPASHPMQLGSTEPNPRNAALLHNGGLPTSMGDMSSATAYPSLNTNCSIGTTVANSMNLTNNTITESVIGSEAPAFKVEPAHQESVYPYQNSCTGTEMNNQTSEGFLSSILGEDDLHLMDMAMNEGMYPMRMMDNACTTTQNCVERNTDSDSAVSSMGSERVPSLSSDTEWMETNSDSGHTPADHYASDYCNKYRWYENYLYGARGPAAGESSPNSTSSRLSQIPQKKYQLYGRRCYQEQNTNNQVMHNHTYHMPPEAMNGATGTVQKPIYRDKMKSKSARKSEDEQLTRDEKKARQLNIPISVSDIINLPMDEFNEKLSTFDLIDEQISLIRDIRRRGKNKVAAQNCRKRKLDQINCLADEVKHMRDRKNKLLQEREFLSVEKQRVQNKYAQLYQHTIQSLRDPGGNPYPPYTFTLQHAADGSVIMVPRNTNSTNLSLEMDPSSAHCSRSKSKDRKP